MNQRYPGLVEHIAELAKARYELDNYDPKDDFTSGSISLSASYAKKDRVSDERANVKQALIDKKYLIAPRGNKKIVGSKGWIKHSVLSVLSTHVGDRTFDAIVHELKSESGIVEK